MTYIENSKSNLHFSVTVREIIFMDHSEHLFTEFEELLLMGNLRSASKVQIFFFVAPNSVLYFCIFVPMLQEY